MVAIFDHSHLATSLPNAASLSSLPVCPPPQPLYFLPLRAEACGTFALSLKLKPLPGVDTAAAYVQAMCNPCGYSVLHILPTTTELTDGTHRVRSPCVSWHHVMTVFLGVP